MEIYLVGGAVRDLQMGIAPKDRDYVVVGATPEMMLGLGYREVGKDFPVFLHPQSSDEYALARLERKTGVGHTDFSVDIAGVTLEEDLFRRDLTVNAMAMTESGSLIDPYGGLADMRSRVLRHVGPAFSEDPLRVLRVGRFLARMGPAWSVHRGTRELMESMVASGSLEALPFERVWKEVARGLMEPHPQLMLDLLGPQLGVFTEVERLRALSRFNSNHANALANAVRANASLACRFACVFDLTGQAVPAAIPRAIVAFEQCARRTAAAGAQRYGGMGASERLGVIEALDVPRQHERAVEVVQALGFMHGIDAAELLAGIDRVAGLDIGAALTGVAPAQIKDTVRGLRLSVV